MELYVLRGPDRVRRRPAVIFGDEGLEGAKTAVMMIVELLAAECAQGHASQLTVTAHADGSLTVANNGRGLWLGEAGSTTWKELFCSLYAGNLYGTDDRKTEFSAFDPDFQAAADPYSSIGYDELTLCAVQCASAFMDVCVHRNALRWNLHFEKGYPEGEVTATPDFSNTGTSIRFLPDAQVFTHTVLPEGWLAQQLQQLALLIPQLAVTYREESETDMTQQVFCYPNGAAGLLQSQIPAYTQAIAAEGRERYNRPLYGASVRVDLTFCRDAGFVHCYHNRRQLYGGTHLEQLTQELCKRLCWQLDLDITPQQLLPHLQLVLQSTASTYSTCWTSGARTGICNQMIADMTQDTLGDHFSYYVKQNRAALLEIFTA